MTQKHLSSVLFGLLLTVVESNLFAETTYSYHYENDQSGVELIFESDDKNQKISIDINVLDASGKTLRIQQTKRNRPAGRTVFKLNVPCTPLTFSGEASVHKNNKESGAFAINFETQCVRDFKVDIKADDLNLTEGTFKVQSNLPLTGLTTEVWYDGDTGAEAEWMPEDVISNAATTFQPQKKMTFHLPKRANTGWHQITILRVKVYAAGEQWQQREFYPWSFSLPHEEVLFESGSDAIRSTEEVKLEPVLEQIRVAYERNKHAFAVIERKPRLWISGFTDRVGSATSNQSLSKRRADSIAGWFSQHGVELEIRARGFGESRLKVQTADNVPNAANRRADYILAFEAPYGGSNGWAVVP